MWRKKKINEVDFKIIFEYIMQGHWLNGASSKFKSRHFDLFNLLSKYYMSMVLVEYPCPISDPLGSTHSCTWLLPLNYPCVTGPACSLVQLTKTLKCSTITK